MQYYICPLYSVLHLINFLRPQTQPELARRPAPGLPLRPPPVGALRRRRVGQERGREVVLKDLRLRAGGRGGAGGKREVNSHFVFKNVKK